MAYLKVRTVSFREGILLKQSKHLGGPHTHGRWKYGGILPEHRGGDQHLESPTSIISWCLYLLLHEQGVIIWHQPKQCSNALFFTGKSFNCTTHLSVICMVWSPMFFLLTPDDDLWVSKLSWIAKVTPNKKLTGIHWREVLEGHGEINDSTIWWN